MATDDKEHKCVKCGKEIKAGQQFTHQGKVYCCDKCCKKDENATNVCEFC